MQLWKYVRHLKCITHQACSLCLNISVFLFRIICQWLLNPNLWIIVKRTEKERHYLCLLLIFWLNGMPAWELRLTRLFLCFVSVTWCTETSHLKEHSYNIKSTMNSTSCLFCSFIFEYLLYRIFSTHVMMLMSFLRLTSSHEILNCFKQNIVFFLR